MQVPKLSHKSPNVHGSPSSHATRFARAMLKLGKAEWLRGRIALEQGRMQEGAQYMLLTYLYLQRFSPEAHQLELLMDDLHDYMRQMDAERKRHFLQLLEQTAGAYDVKDEVSFFIQDLRALP